LQPGDRNELTRLVSIYQRIKPPRYTSLVQLLEPMMQDSLSLSKFGLILVNAYNETNDLGKAKELVQRIINGDPTNCSAHQTYAYILLKRERYADAIPVLQAGVKACPKDPDMWIQLGDSYYFSNSKSKEGIKKARDAYDRGCQLGGADGCQKKEQVETLLARPGLR
jgi:predicted Zn-dependent protease